MAFDFTLAIARLGGTGSTGAALREKYPELDFLFDELDDLREQVEEMVDADLYGQTRDKLEIAQDNAADLRDQMESVIFAAKFDTEVEEQISAWVGWADRIAML